MRELTCGRWSWSIHQGGIHSGKPSAFIRQVQPFLQKVVVVISAEQRLSRESASWGRERGALWLVQRGLRPWSGLSGRAGLLELQHVVRCADQAPFALHRCESAAGESAVSEVRFEVAEDGLDAVLPFAVEVGVAG
ncbi:MAG TPA: hypothetical protein VNB87_15110 [Propionibacteriaceae bacterium]|jgi:hypothetical protein|nr:hypothetical protein [Propionibacteriaceae bacterium]